MLEVDDFIYYPKQYLKSIWISKQIPTIFLEKKYSEKLKKASDFRVSILI